MPIWFSRIASSIGIIGIYHFGYLGGFDESLIDGSEKNVLAYYDDSPNVKQSTICFIDPRKPNPPAFVTTFKPAALPDTTLLKGFPGSISRSSLSPLARIFLRNAAAISPPVKRAPLKAPDRARGAVAAAKPLATTSNLPPL
jgi:hypothetical protein